MKRTRLTDENVASRPPLGDSAAAIVLDGWGAHPPSGRCVDEAGLFELFQQHEDGIGRLWREHERWLRDVAAAWHIAPGFVLADGRALFFGEFVGLPQAVRSAYWLARTLEAAEAIASDDDGGDVLLRHEDTP